MDLSKVKRCSDFHDKAMAVGTVACLEDHFRRISKLLDDNNVPTGKFSGSTFPLPFYGFTVYQRVQLLVLALIEFAGDSPNTYEQVFAACLKDVDTDEPLFDPAELNAWISDKPESTMCPSGLEN